MRRWEKGLLAACCALPLALAAPLATVRDPRQPILRQPLSAQEQDALKHMLERAEAKPTYRALGVGPLTLDNVLLSFSAPFRRAQAERLTVLRADSQLLLLWNEGEEAWRLPLAEGCAPTLAYTLRDVNLDGLREVAAQVSCGEEVPAALLILDFSAVAPRALGTLPLLRRAAAPYLLEVAKGQPPRFFARSPDPGKPSAPARPLSLRERWRYAARPLWP